jgi:DNA-3-methyladenine glycosylase
VTKLSREFFNRPTLKVAQDLLGKILVFGNHRAIITETEAYVGIDDPACHAYRGRTKRTEVMFGPPGYSYVYLIYGMYYCLNFITEEEGFAAGVLIRGAKLLTEPYLNLNGPGKLCKFLQITKQHNAIDIVESDNFYVLDQNVMLTYKITPRIGIKQGTDKLWRFLSTTILE